MSVAATLERPATWHPNWEVRMLPQPTTPIEERFWSKVREDESGCWLWAAFVTPIGYGQFWRGDRLVRPHRWAYEALVGPIPDGLSLDHL